MCQVSILRSFFQSRGSVSASIEKSFGGKQIVWPLPNFQQAFSTKTSCHMTKCFSLTWYASLMKQSINTYANICCDCFSLLRPTLKTIDGMPHIGRPVSSSKIMRDLLIHQYSGRLFLCTNWVFFGKVTTHPAWWLISVKKKITQLSISESRKVIISNPTFKIDELHV